jgi:citrate synthase
MARVSRPIRSDICWSTPERIVVHGHDLPEELLGRIDFGQMAFLELTGRLPAAGESIVFNALLVALVEHGLSPSALVARMTYAGAPESVQAAVAAGLCGLGSVFVGSMDDAARMLRDALPAGRARDASDQRIEQIAAEVAADFHARRALVPGIGHPFHKPVDPRAPRLFALAAQHGLSGPYVKLVQRIAAACERLGGRTLPVNATGAIGAICCELDLPQTIIRGLGVMARAVGLIGHILEESRQPVGIELWRRAEDEAAEPHRAAARPPPPTA